MPMESKNPTAENHGYSIIVITKNNCVQCDATKRRLDDIGLSAREKGEPQPGENAIAYSLVNAEEDQTLYEEFDGHTAFDFVTQVNGVRQMPFVIVDHPDYVYPDTFHGMRPDKLRDLAKDITKRRNEADESYS